LGICLLALLARLIEREFDPARPVYARKYFIASGRKYVPGDAFDWKAAMVTPRRAQQMFDAGKLTHKDKEPAKEAPKQADVTVKDEEVTPERIKQEYTPERKPEPLESLDYYDAPLISEGYDLDAIDDMKELRRIADEIGAPYKVSKADQRQAIRDHKETM